MSRIDGPKGPDFSDRVPPVKKVSETENDPSRGQSSHAERGADSVELGHVRQQRLRQLYEEQSRLSAAIPAAPAEQKGELYARLTQVNGEIEKLEREEP